MDGRDAFDGPRVKLGVQEQSIALLRLIEIAKLSVTNGQINQGVVADQTRMETLGAIVVPCLAELDQPIENLGRFSKCAFLEAILSAVEQKLWTVGKPAQG